MRISVAELARMINGTIEGDPERYLEKFAPIEEADELSLSFISNLKYSHYLYTTKAAAVLVGNDFVPEKSTDVVLIHVEDVYTTMSSLLEQFSKMQTRKTGIEHPSFIAESAKTGKDVYIGAFAYIGENASIGDGVMVYPHSYIGDGVTIGNDTIIYSGVKIYAACEIGSECILHSGCVIGSDGFGFAPQEDGTYRKIPQTGKVILRDRVEIGANTTVDRATISATIIESGVKLDNLIQVAHNVEIGENTAIAAQAGISGSTKIGKNVAIGGQVGIVGHINIADGTQIGAQSGVSKTIAEKNHKWFGSPAIDYKNAIKAQLLFKKLPELYDRIQSLEQAIIKLNVREKDE
jgi:UDP-3-O-[3-hydroxymyristoyl] glucosamine N-acyltransferase